MKVALLNFLVITLMAPVMLYGAEDNAARAAADLSAAGKVTKIVIDPGHGGVDPGTNLGSVLEKDIVLNVAKELGSLIKKNLPDVEVVYTRTTDVYVTLNERSNIANRAKADVFLSIHVNAVKDKPEVTGTSTFVMGNDKSGANLSVAMKENSVANYEPNFSTTYEGFIPDDPASYIIFNLQQFANQDQSMILAETIQRHYTKELPLRDRGAYHGPFLVLWRTAMPSVLTEIGFMTNKKDREYVASAKGQRAAARALFNAFSEYKSRIEQRSTMVQLKVEEPVAGDQGTQTAQAVSTDKPATAGTEFKGEYSGANSKVRTTLPDISSKFPADDDKKTVRTQEQQSTADKPVGQAVGAQSQQSKPATQSGTAMAQKPAATTTKTAQKDKILYYVQIAALDKPLNTNSADFKSWRGKVTEKRRDGRFAYKYLVGGVPSYSEAQSILAQARREFPDAFMVAFDGDEQITAAEARQRQNRK